MSEWTYGGGAELFRDLTWSNRPDMAGSDAPQSLQDAWVATMLAIKDELGAVKNGNCFLVNATAGPLVQQVLGEPVALCAGYAAFVEHAGRSEYGMRWRPEKWAKWIDDGSAAHVAPLRDIHVWLETATHVVDFTTGDTLGEALWPALIHWPKWRFPKHPREAQRPGQILLWRNPKALASLRPLAPLMLPLSTRAAEIMKWVPDALGSAVSQSQPTLS